MNLFNKQAPTTTGGFMNTNPLSATTNPTTTFGTNLTTTAGLGGATSGLGGFNKPLGGTSLGGATTQQFGGGAGQSFLQQQPTGSTTQQGLGMNMQPQTTSSGLFGGNKSLTFGGTTQQSGFGNTSTTSGGFGGQTGITGIQQPQQAASSMSYINPQINTQAMPPVFTLLPTNYLKYEKISTLQDDIKRLIGKIELDLKNNEIYLDYADNMFKGLNENFKVISGEGVKVVKFCKLINSKNSKIKFILETLKNEIDHQSDLLKKERKNFHILEQHPTFKISIPSEYFFNLTKEIEEKMALQIQQISDLEALINLYYRKEYGSFKVNSDIVEELIRELYTCLISLVSEAARINEYVSALKINYIEMMKYNYGWKEMEIENRIRAHMALGEEIENIYYK